MTRFHPDVEDLAYKAGYEGSPYLCEVWGERFKPDYHAGANDARRGYPPNCRIAVDDSGKASGGYF